MRLFSGLVTLLFLGACTDQTTERPKPAPAAETTTAPTAELPADTGAPSPAPTTRDAAPADPQPPATGKCTSKFGSGITAEFGRLDGRVRAVVVPGNFSCPGDDNHAIVQVDVADTTYQIWVNVESDRPDGDTTVRFLEKKPTGAAFTPGGAWSAGWHPSPGRFDYALDLGVAVSSFKPITKNALATMLSERAKPGTRVMIYADGFNTADGAHKVHRNSGGRDGAIVLDPTGTPVYLLFAFATQTF